MSRIRPQLHVVSLGLLGVSLAGCFPELPSRLELAPEPIDVSVGSDAGDVAPDMAPPADVGPTDDLGADEGPDAGDPPLERCNGLDDDGDGAVDEQFPVGEPCEAGQGECRAAGSLRCAADGMGVDCDAMVGEPGPDICNGLDDDCSGVIDEGFADVGDGCTAGLGVCEAEGGLRCSDDGSETVCSVGPAEARSGPESCNAVDDDCDGSVDEGLVRGCTTGAEGACGPGRAVCNAGVWGACAGDIQPGERIERCNGLDDDCDGRIDQDQLPFGPAACPGCEVGLIVDGCIPATACVQQCDPEDDREIICAPAAEANCDGQDDDCDGVADDDGVCGQPVVDTCSFGLGWTTDPVDAPSAEWGECDIESGDLGDTYSCNRTRGEMFGTIDLPRGADLDVTDDKLGINFRCSPGAVGDYIVGHCRVILGVATDAAGVADGVEAWGPCPAGRVGGDAEIACTSTTADGGFDPMPVPFDLTVDQLMAVAFVCEDPMDPGRAAALEASLAVSLAWADSAIEGEVDWMAVCAPLGDGQPYTACATSQGDGRFRTFRLTADVDAGDRFAVSLRAIGR